MKIQRRGKQYSNEYTIGNALKNGSVHVWLSILIFGYGCLIRKQIVKGLLFLAAELLVIQYMIMSGFHDLSKLVTLGDTEQQKVWNEEKSIFEYVDGDRSLIILLYGIVTIAVLIFALIMMTYSVKCAYKAEKLQKEGKKVPNFREEVQELFNQNLQLTLLSLPVLGTLAFTVLPLIFMMSMAFTNYSVQDNKLVLFDWVGLQNFKDIVSFTGNLGATFWSVLGWTLI